MSGVDGGWPDASKPGVPMNPERDGVHRMTFDHREEHDWIWRATPAPFWVTHTGRMVDPHLMVSFRAHYIGPLLTPAERDAALARGRADVDAAVLNAVKEALEDGDVTEAFSIVNHAIRARSTQK